MANELSFALSECSLSERSVRSTLDMSNCCSSSFSSIATGCCSYSSLIFLLTLTVFGCSLRVEYPRHSSNVVVLRSVLGIITDCLMSKRSRGSGYGAAFLAEFLRFDRLPLLQSSLRTSSPSMLMPSTWLFFLISW